MKSKMKWLSMTTIILIALEAFSQDKINLTKLDSKEKLNDSVFKKEAAAPPLGGEKAHDICGVPFLESQGQWVSDHPHRLPLNTAQLRKRGRLDANGNLVLDEVGDLRSFWVWDFHEKKDYTITARAQKKGIHGYVYLDTTETLSDEVLTNIINEFDTKIYPTTTQNFGSEWKPGIDNDSLITLLIYDIKDDKYYDPSVKSFVIGYFHPKDEYQKSIYSTSNEREMFYLDLNPTTPGSSTFYGALAHEFQHMIHWNNDRDEETWVNEGCSEYASFINGYPRGSLSDFLSAPDNNLIVWGSELGDYQQVFLWTLYFAEHYGGAPTIKKLVAEPKNGIDGIEQVLADLDYVDATFSSIFSDWVIANYLNDTSIAGGKYGYEEIDLPTISPEAIYPQLPVALTATTVSGWAADYIEFWGAQDLTLNFDGGGTLPFKVRVLKLGEGISPAVVDIPLDQNRDGSLALPGFGSDYDKAVLVPSLNSNIAGNYSYSAEGTTTPAAIEIAYDDNYPYYIWDFNTNDTVVVTFDGVSNTVLDSVRVLFYSTGSVEFHIWESSSQTFAARDLITPFTLQVTDTTTSRQNINWQTVDLRPYSFDSSRDFVLGYVIGSDAPNPRIISDSLASNPHRSFVYTDHPQYGSGWYYTAGDFIFRAYLSVRTSVPPISDFGPDVPETYALLQNYPNPFNASTVIRYSIPVDHQRVSLKIYNLLGQEVRTLVDESQGRGLYSVKWDGKDTYGEDVSSGVYIYRLKSGNFTSGKKMVIVR